MTKIDKAHQISNEFHLHSVICNDQMQTAIREHKISKVRCQKLTDGILFTKIDTGEKIKMPYSECQDFAMAILESYCDFTMNGKINIDVTVKCNK